MKRVAIIILNWNGSKLMRQFLPSVVRHTPDWAEVIVADNGSTDDSLELLRTHFPTVKTLVFDRNYGFAEGYNRAIAAVDHAYCVLLNSDVEVTPHWLDAPIAALDADPNVACVQPKIRAWREKEKFEYAGAAGGFMDRYGYPFCRGRVLHVVEKDEGQYDEPMDLLWATGACLFVRTAIYKEAGGLDARFFAHQEEVDLCWRLRTRGYRICCTPASVVYHVGGATLEMEHPRKTFLNFRNNLLMLYKNLPEKDLKPVMRARFWLDYVAALQFLLKGHFPNAKAVYEARKAFSELLPTYATVRAENLRLATGKPIPERMRKSLIWAFYGRGKRRFSALRSYLSMLLCGLVTLLSACLHEINNTYAPGPVAAVTQVHGDSAFVMANTRLGWVYDSRLSSHLPGECLLLDFTYDPAENKRAEALGYYYVSVKGTQTVDQLTLSASVPPTDRLLSGEQPVVDAVSPLDSSLCVQLEDYLFLPAVCWTNQPNNLQWQLSYSPGQQPEVSEGKQIYPLFLRVTAAGEPSESEPDYAASLHAFDISALRQVGGGADDRFVKVYYVNGINPSDSTAFTWGVTEPIAIH